MTNFHGILLPLWSVAKVLFSASLICPTLQSKERVPFALIIGEMQP